MLSQQILLANEEDTTDAARIFAAELRVGDLVSLTGTLGAGKTFFVRECLRALGITGRIGSPTYGVASVYEEAEPMLIHCDLYRLESLLEFQNTGVDELLPQAITFVEWGEKLEHLEYTHKLELDIKPDASRMLTIINCADR